MTLVKYTIGSDYQWGGGGDRYVLLATKYCFPFPVKNPRKLKVKQLTNYPRSEDETTAIEKNPGYVLPAIVFFLQRKYLDSI